jgi:hypothetical protein
MPGGTVSSESLSDSRKLGVAQGPQFLRLMKRYVVDYTNSHDQAETAAIMEPGYTLRMGEHVLTGRDGDYARATRRQLDQFPGLGLTVHEIWTSGERLAMRFSEHGASVRHGGARAVWGGIALYEWNGARLTANSVEQDYFSRASQLTTGIPNRVEPPAIAPWDTAPAAPDEQAADMVREWLEEGDFATTPGILCDDAAVGARMVQIVEQTSITINDLFSCGSVVAFHIAQHGTLAADFAGDPAERGTAVTLYSAGIVHVSQAGLECGRVIRNRLDLRRAFDKRQ